ncbi:MAG TPA: hypothetical protein VIL43_01845 [Burkholderiales bacterium]
MSFASAYAGCATRWRAVRNAAIASAVLLATAGCAMPPPRGLIEIDPTSSALWLRADEVQDYRCRVGLLECRDSTGRLGERRCRCVE